MIKHEAFNELVNKALEENVFPGCNIGIIKKNNDGNYNDNLFSFGYKALYPNKEENNIDTLYDMASCSKVISTTTCIMILAQEGKIRFYDTVCTYLPDFCHKDTTIFDLLTHTAGLPACLAGCHTMTREQIINGIMNAELVCEKGTKILYSDLGFLTLGLIVESVSKMSLAEFAKVKVFEPLEMFDTCYNPKDVMRCAPTEDRGQFIDRGYVHDEMSHNIGGVAGHAGVFSTVKDISHFIKMILNDGVYNGKKILDKKIIDIFYKAQVEEKEGVSVETNKRSLGWIVKCKNSSCGDFTSDETILHTGFTGTNIFIDRINKVGFVMLSNRVHPTRNNPRLIPFRSKLANYVLTHLEEF